MCPQLRGHQGRGPRPCWQPGVRRPHPRLLPWPPCAPSLGPSGAGVSTQGPAAAGAAEPCSPRSTGSPDSTGTLGFFLSVTGPSSLRTGAGSPTHAGERRLGRTLPAPRPHPTARRSRAQQGDLRAQGLFVERAPPRRDDTARAPDVRTPLAEQERTLVPPRLGRRAGGSVAHTTPVPRPCGHCSKASLPLCGPSLVPRGLRTGSVDLEPLPPRSAFASSQGTALRLRGAAEPGPVLVTSLPPPPSSAGCAGPVTQLPS